MHNTGAEPTIEKVYKRDIFLEPVVYELSFLMAQDGSQRSIIVKDIRTAGPYSETEGRSFRFWLQDLSDRSEFDSHPELLVARVMEENKHLLLEQTPYASQIDRIIYPRMSEVIPTPDDPNSKILRLFFGEKITERTLEDYANLYSDPEGLKIVANHLAIQLDILHSIGIAHGDLTELNILVPEDLSPEKSSVLIDFGLATLNRPEKKRDDIIQFIDILLYCLRFDTNVEVKRKVIHIESLRYKLINNLKNKDFIYPTAQQLVVIAS